tara:strand:- start:56 stop:241 length:186 start_codon:yes stop_codon:yes gene_type:complete
VNKKSKLSIQEQIQVLEETIEWYEAQIKPTACGWMKTTVSGIRNRIKDLQRQLPPRLNIHL